MQNPGDISSKTNTWSTSNTEWAQIERLDFWDPDPYPELKSIIKTITNILLNMTRKTIPNFKLFIN